MILHRSYCLLVCLSLSLFVLRTLFYNPKPYFSLVMLIQTLNLYYTLSASLSLSLVTSISYFQVNSGFECGLALSSFTDFQDGDEVECMKVVWTVRTLSLQDGASGSLYDPVKDKKKNMVSKNKKQSNNSY